MEWISQFPSSPELFKLLPRAIQAETIHQRSISSSAFHSPALTQPPFCPKTRALPNANFSLFSFYSQENKTNRVVLGGQTVSFASEKS